MTPHPNIDIVTLVSNYRFLPASTPELEAEVRATITTGQTWRFELCVSIRPSFEGFRFLISRREGSTNQYLHGAGYTRHLQTADGWLERGSPRLYAGDTGYHERRSRGEIGEEHALQGTIEARPGYLGGMRLSTLVTV